MKAARGPWEAHRRYNGVVLALGLLVSGCNSPPFYESRAADFLREQSVAPEVIEALTRRQPLGPEAVAALREFDDVAVLHLLGANPGTPGELLTQLAQHRDFEVRTGVASNSTALPALLASLRTEGKYTTENCVLAGNAALSTDVLRDMFRGEEATLECFGSNEHAPREVMEAIVDRGSTTAKARVAPNPALPRDLFDRLFEETEPAVRDHLRLNPNYDQWKAQ